MEGASRWRAAGVGICLLTSCVESHGIDSGADAAGSFDARSDEGAARPPSHVRWARAFPVLEPGAWGGGSGGASVTALSEGDVVLAGATSGAVDLGGGRLEAPSSGPCIDSAGSTVLLGRFRSSGEHVWSRTLGDTYSSGASYLTTVAADDLVLVGSFLGTLGVDGIALQSTSWDPRSCGPGDPFVARFRGSDGSAAWAFAWSGVVVTGVAADGDGDVFVSGAYEDLMPVDLGGGTLPDLGRGGLFVAKLSGADGSHLWSRGYPAPRVYTSWHDVLAVDARGDVLLAAVTTDGVDLGGGPLPDGGGVTMVVAKLSGVDGAHVWSRSLFSPGPGEVIPQAVATTPDDDVVVTGWTWDAPVDLGGGELPSGRPAAFTVRLSGLDGAHVWSRPLGGSSVAVAPDGEWLVVAGGFTGALDCGGGVTLHGPSDGSGDDAFVVLLDASDGRLRWCESFAGDGYQEVGSAAVDASGEITVTGDFQRVMSVGPFTLDSGPEGVAMFVAHLVSGSEPTLPDPPDEGADGGAPGADGGAEDASAVGPPPARMCPSDVSGAPDPAPSCVSPSPPPVRACPGDTTCGNGRIDGACADRREECDGASLDGEDCTSFGYAGGTLRCGADCAFDVSGCSSCPLDDRVAACTTTALDAPAPLVIDLVVTADEVAVAWLSGPDDSGAVGLRFARLDHALVPLFESDCLARFEQPLSPFVAVSPSPNGWWVAANGFIPGPAGEPWMGFVLVPLDHDGRPRGPARRFLPGFEPRLVPVPGGSPLLVWQDTDLAGPMHAALLCEDGSEAWRVDVFDEVYPTFARGAVFADGGILLAARDGPDFAVRRLELDGALSRPIRLGSSGNHAQLAWDGEEARIVYLRASEAGLDGIVWRRLDRTGAPLAEPVLLGRYPMYSVASLAALGTDSVVLLGGGSTLAGHAAYLDATRLGPSGETRVAPFAVLRDPSGVGSYRVVTAGETTFVAWGIDDESFTSDWRRRRIGLSRLAL